MDLNDMNSKLGGMMGGGGNPADLLNKLSIPDCDRTTEYGSHNGAEAFDGLGDQSPGDLNVVQITVYSGAILDSIAVTYADGTTVKHGRNSGSPTTIDLRGNAIKRVYGEYDVDFGGRPLISRLCIEPASGKPYGPYGWSSSGKRFSFGQDGSHVAGFFGSTRDGYIASLGGYLMK